MHEPFKDTDEGMYVPVINSWINGSTNFWNSDRVFRPQVFETGYKSATYGLINTKTYEGVNINLHTFFTSALDGDGWSSSLLFRFNPEEGVRGTHWIEESWASSTAGIDIAKRRKSSALSEIELWFLSCPANSLFTVLTELFSFPSILKCHSVSTMGIRVIWFHIFVFLPT
jgi:hypothetical protein